jgi:hypothetical protein
MNWKIFKREKPNPSMPEPMFDDNWRQEQYEKNVKEGVKALQHGKTISIMDDGRGYELALEIKRNFILAYQKQLSEQIKIEGQGTITIKRTV